jgi:hypothetical protein
MCLFLEKFDGIYVIMQMIEGIGAASIFCRLISRQEVYADFIQRKFYDGMMAGCFIDEEKIFLLEGLIVKCFFFY